MKRCDRQSVSTLNVPPKSFFALSQQGHQVRAAARRVERLEKQRLANVSCHKVDLHWPENLP
ncbi:hypothetical protein, partial [Salmonella enterica]|uniref:hypothetical protein n=1 Tax=Salmonella enterica TaxID=28901 RepID=UPI0011BF7972